MDVDLLDNICFDGADDRNNGGHNVAGVSHQSHSHNLMKGKPKKYTNEQIHKLECTYRTNKYITKVIRHELSENLNLSERQIKNWFQVKLKIGCIRCITFQNVTL